MLALKVGYTCCQCGAQEWGYMLHREDSRALAQSLLQHGWHSVNGLWWCPAHSLDYYFWLLKEYWENHPASMPID
jgi:hypothetical protein